MNDEDLEYVYRLSCRVVGKKNSNYSLAYLNIKKHYGKKGLEILNQIYHDERIKTVKWILRNKQEYCKKVKEMRYDFVRVKAGIMDFKEYKKKWNNFITIQDLKAETY